MAELEMLQETKREGADTGQPGLLIAIQAPSGSDALSAVLGKLARACGMLSVECQAAVAFPGEAAPEAASNGADGGVTRPDVSPMRVLNYPPPPTDPGAIAWLPNAAAYRAVSGLAARLGARACTVLGGSVGSGRDSLTPERLTLLLDPAMEGGFDLVMPLYTAEAFDDLVNKSILYPMTRALYGHRIHNPLGIEFQMSWKLFSALAMEPRRDSTRLYPRLPWLGTVAANQGLKICQVRLGTRRPSSTDGTELSDALAQLASPLFADMEDNAAFWQRIRGSHEVPTFGSPQVLADTSSPIDARRMVDAFQLGVGNLREIWSLILPPLTLLELKKVAHTPPEDFHLEDSLWARIVYDFALAYRLRNIRRAHLFGALTPLYLGWVASYAVEINKSGTAAAEERVEKLARAYEAEKPYLLSRWRWPDRFHP